MNARIKLSARAALYGAQIKIIPIVTAIMLLTLIFSLCNAAVNSFAPVDKRYFFLVFSAASLSIFLFAVSPLRLLLEIRHLLLARGKRALGQIRMGFSGILKSCGMSALLFVLKLFWIAVFEGIPVSAAVIFFFYNSKESVSLKAAYAVWVGIFALAAAGLLFFLLFIQRYSKAMFYLACFKDMTVIEAVEESVRKTDGRLLDIFLFKLGFAPWFLLCIGIVPALFVVPYYKQSLTCYFLSR